MELKLLGLGSSVQVLRLSLGCRGCKVSDSECRVSV